MRRRASWIMIGMTAVLAWSVAASMNHAQTAGAGAGGTRIGVVDLVRVFNEFEQTKVLNREMESYKAKIAADKQAWEEKIDVEKNTLQSFAPDSAEYHQRKEALKKLVVEYRVWLEVEQNNLTEEHRRWIERTYDMVIEHTAQVAKAAGVQLVVTREELDKSVTETNALLKQILNRKVVYSDPDLDLTTQVLTSLNDAFAKNGGAQSIKFGS